MSIFDDIGKAISNIFDPQDKPLKVGKSPLNEFKNQSASNISDIEAYLSSLTDNISSSMDLSNIMSDTGKIDLSKSDVARQASNLLNTPFKQELTRNKKQLDQIIGRYSPQILNRLESIKRSRTNPGRSATQIVGTRKNLLG